MTFGKDLVRSAEEALRIAKGKSTPARAWAFRINDDEAVANSSPAPEGARKQQD